MHANAVIIILHKSFINIFLYFRICLLFSSDFCVFFLSSLTDDPGSASADVVFLFLLLDYFLLHLIITIKKYMNKKYQKLLSPFFLSLSLSVFRSPSFSFSNYISFSPSHTHRHTQSLFFSHSNNWFWYSNLIMFSFL